MAEPARQFDPYDSETPAASIRPHLQALEGGGETSEPVRGHLGAVGDDNSGAADQLRNAEESGDQSSPSSSSASTPDELSQAEKSSPPDRSGFSAADDINERLGRGYTGKGSVRSKGLSRLYGSSSGFKKKIALAGAAASGSVIIGILVFLALLPLKIEHIVTNLENKFDATATSAIGTETDNLFSAYITKQVLPNLNKAACHTTIDPGCASVAKGSGPIAKLYNGWRDGHLEQKLATEHGIVFGKSGSKFTLTTQGQTFNIHTDNIFDFDGATGATRNQVRRAVNDALKSGTLWDKTYVRFKVNTLLDRKYGVKLCVIACDSRDKFTDSVADKKLAAKAYIVNRVVTPLSESYGLIMQCIMEGSCDTALANAEPGDDARLSPFQKRLQAQLVSYAAGDAEKLAKLVGTATDISKDGFTKYIAKQIGEKIAGEVGGKAASDAVPAVGWALLIGQLVEIGGHLGPIVQYAGYAANSAAAIQLYETYNTVASEMKSGHMDATELGSFTDALSTNLSGSSDNQSDAASTPLYSSLFDNSTTSSSTLGSLLSGTAYADPSTTTSPYTCDDGSGVPAGKLVCPEEELTKGNAFANNISGSINKITSAVPGFSFVLSAINHVNSAIGSITGAAFNDACHTIFWPECPSAVNYFGGKASDLMSFITKQLVVSPIDDQMSGGRSSDMMIAGADATYNKSCQIELGCAQVSDQLVADIRNNQEAEAKSQFDSMSMFARIFSTDSPYSLVSKLAMDMPTSFLSATNASFASLLSNPFSKIGDAFSSLFSKNVAFAAASAQPDPFGIVQYGYADNQIPSDPETYWQQNCADPANPDQLDQTKLTAWLNSQTQDPDTGEAVAKTPNPCLLIQSTVQSAGALFDDSLLPSGSQNQGSD